MDRRTLISYFIYIRLLHSFNINNSYLITWLFSCEFEYFILWKFLINDCYKYI